MTIKSVSRLGLKFSDLFGAVALPVEREAGH